MKTILLSLIGDYLVETARACTIFKKPVRNAAALLACCATTFSAEPIESKLLFDDNTFDLQDAAWTKESDGTGFVYVLDGYERLLRIPYDENGMQWTSGDDSLQNELFERGNLYGILNVDDLFDEPLQSDPTITFLRFHDVDIALGNDGSPDGVVLAGTITVDRIFNISGFQRYVSYAVFAKLGLDGKPEWLTAFGGLREHVGQNVIPNSRSGGRAIAQGPDGRFYGVGQHRGGTMHRLHCQFDQNGEIESTYRDTKGVDVQRGRLENTQNFNDAPIGLTSKYAVFDLGVQGAFESDRDSFNTLSWEAKRSNGNTIPGIGYTNCSVLDIAVSSDGKKVYFTGTTPGIYQEGNNGATIGDQFEVGVDPWFSLRFNGRNLADQHQDVRPDWTLQGDQLTGNWNLTAPVVFALDSTLGRLVGSYCEPLKEGEFEQVYVHESDVFVSGTRWKDDFIPFETNGQISEGVVIKLDVNLDLFNSQSISRVMPASGEAVVRKMFADADGDLYVAGDGPSGTMQFGNIPETSAGGRRLFWGKVAGSDLSWEWVRETGKEAPGDDQGDAITLPLPARNVLLGYSRRDDFIFEEETSNGEVELSVKEYVGVDLFDRLFAIYTDDAGRFSRFVNLTVRANFGQNGISNDGDIGIAADNILVEEFIDELNSIRVAPAPSQTGEGIDYLVPTGRSVRVSVPEEAYYKVNDLDPGKFEYIDPDVIGSNGESFEERIRNEAQYRFTSDGYLVPNSLTQGTINEYTYTVEDDFTIQFRWITSYALDIESNFEDINGQLTSRASGNPVPLAGKKHWIAKNEQVVASIDGTVAHPDPVEYLTRFVVLGYEASGAAAADSVLGTLNTDFRELADGTRFRPMVPGESRQQIESFTMSEPSKITYRWGTQHGIRVSTTSPAAEKDPVIKVTEYPPYLDRSLDETVSSDRVESAWYYQAPDYFPGSGINWFFEGTKINIAARYNDTADPGSLSNKTPNGVLLNTGALATATATGSGTSLGFNNVSVDQGATVTFQYGERIYRGIVDIGSPVDFVNDRSSGDKSISGNSPIVLATSDIASGDLSGQAMTIEFWAKRDPGIEGVVLSHLDGDGNSLRIGFGSNDRLYVNVSNGNEEESAQTSPVPDDDEFHHYAVRFSGDEVGVSRDGEAWTTVDFQGGYGGNLEEISLVLGTIPVSDGNPDPGVPFTGSLDNLQVWSGALERADLQTDPTKREVVDEASPFDGQGNLKDSLFLVRSFDAGQTFYGPQSLPSSAPAGVRPGITVLDGPSGSTAENSAIWDDKNKRLYPTRPGRYLLRWPKTPDADPEDDEEHLFLDVITRFPLEPDYRHVVNSPPVELDPEADDRFAFLEMHYSESPQAQVDNNGKTFTNNDPDGTIPGETTSTAAGRSVLVLTDAGDDNAIATGNPGTEDLIVKVVESRAIARDLPLPFGQRPTVASKTSPDAVVGSTLAHPVTAAGTERGFVYRDEARYHAGFHSASAGSGPIIPVNQDFTDRRDREFLVVWYEKRDLIEWPATPYLYTPTYPTKEKRIVIASQLGSEGVDFDNELQEVFDASHFDQVAIYSQNDPNLAGYNPNEEHALMASSFLNVGAPDAAPTAYALRTDQNVVDEGAGFTSRPYVLVEYRDIRETPPVMGMFAYQVQNEADVIYGSDSASSSDDTFTIHPKLKNGEEDTTRFRDFDTSFTPLVFTSAGHGLQNGQTVTVASVSPAAGTGLVTGGEYYVTGRKENTFQLSETRAGAPVSGNLPSSVEIRSDAEFVRYPVTSIATTRSVEVATPYVFTITEDGEAASPFRTNDTVLIRFDRELPGFVSGEEYLVESSNSDTGEIRLASPDNPGTPIETTDFGKISPVRLTGGLQFGVTGHEVDENGELILVRENHGFSGDSLEVSVVSRRDSLLVMSSAYVVAVDDDRFKLKRSPSSGPVVYQPSQTLTTDEKSALTVSLTEAEKSALLNSVPESGRDALRTQIEDGTFAWERFNPVSEVIVTTAIIPEEAITNSTIQTTPEIRFPNGLDSVEGSFKLYFTGDFAGLVSGATYSTYESDGAGFGLEADGVAGVPVLHDGSEITAGEIFLERSAGDSVAVSTISHPTNQPLFVERSGHGFSEGEKVKVAGIADHSICYVVNATEKGFGLRWGPDGTAILSDAVRELSDDDGDYIEVTRLWPYTFRYRMRAGEPVVPPYPLSNVIGPTPCIETICKDGSQFQRTAFRDHKDQWWAVSGNTTLLGGFYYPLLPHFDVTDVDLGGGTRLSDYATGTCVPWMLDPTDPGDALQPNPFEVSYRVFWPDSKMLPEEERESVPELKAGESLTFSGGEAKGDRERRGEQGVKGLPGVVGWSAGEVVYDDLNRTMDSATISDLYLLRLIHPLRERSVPFPLESLPDELKPGSPDVQVDGSRIFFKNLHAGLQDRVYYDTIGQKIVLRGFVNGKTDGDGSLTEAPPSLYTLRPNILTKREIRDVEKIGNTAWATTVAKLADLAQGLEDEGSPDDPDYNSVRYGVGLFENNQGKIQHKPQLGPGLAVVPNPAISGPVYGFEGGYATLAENNREELGAAPITMHIVKVVPEKFRGAVQTVFPPNIYDEKITARFSGDFGAKPEDIQFQWIYREEDGERHDPPVGKLASEYADLGWNLFPDLTGTNGVGMNEAVFEALGKIIIQDNLVFTRWKHRSEPESTRAEPEPESNWSEWAGAANNFPEQGQYQAQLIDGWVKRVMRGLNHYDARFTDFRNNDSPATYASMIQQAGPRHEGAIAFNPDKDVIENVGLIEAYQSVLDRAGDLTINLLSPETGPGANNAILLAASRLSDLYHLLGNEAYVDALNPTIGFTSAGGEYGRFAPSIFAFQNQLPSLLDEELTLLRGHSRLGAAPTYNRLLWNFTIGQGEAAYQMNYGVWDANNDGFINEADGRKMYPMGHGDAWGHYTTALKTWYKLLGHRNFTWESRAELFQLEGQVVDVDYLDERKFAKVAADRARAGTEIVTQTYRKEYVADPEGQWQGYKDIDPNRGWGVTEWARRTGHAALFDWATANALLPDEAPNQSDLIGLESVSSDDGGQSYQIEVTEGLDSRGLGDLRIPYLLRIQNAGERIAESTFSPEHEAVNSGVAIDAAGISDGATVFTVTFADGSPVTGLTASDFYLAVDKRPRGIRRVDRTTVTDLSSIATQALAVQGVLDDADAGLNPLGVTPDIVPFDTPPPATDGDDLFHTHFDHVYSRTMTAMGNAAAAFDHANEFSNLLRENEDSVEEMTQVAIDQDLDFRNQLIEIFGMPYEGQIGAGRAYPPGYNGPDLYLYMYADATGISARTIPPPDPGFEADLRNFNITKITTIDGNHDVDGGDGNFLRDGVLSAFFSGDIAVGAGTGLAAGPGNAERYQSLTQSIESHYASGGIRFPQSSGDFTFQAPPSWGRRLATGELQDLQMEMIQADAAIYMAVDAYTGHVNLIQDTMELIEAQYEHDLRVLDADEDFRETFKKLKTGVLVTSATSAALGQILESTDDTLEVIKNSVVEIAGLSTTVGNAATGPASTATAVLNAIATGAKLTADLAGQGLEFGIELSEKNKDLEIQREDIALGLQEKLHELAGLIRSENVLRVEILAASEHLRQVSGSYRATLQRGTRVLEERRNLNARIAASTTESRYRDMTFRLARNDAMQKYRAAFQHAARNAFTLAKVYDYETNLDPRDPASAHPLLAGIVRARSIGVLDDGEPTLEGGGLSEITYRLRANFDVLKAQMGLNNAQVENGRFSLRSELFRIGEGGEADELWRQTLEQHRKRDLWTVPEFRRYCRAPQSRSSGELPGLVIPFESYIVAGKNFFGWPLGPNDNAYDPSNFATKARSAGVWLEGYNNGGTGGMLSNTPRVYLIPAGNDVMTIPNSPELRTRVWNAVDAKLPIPLAIGSVELNDPNWIPMRDSVDGGLGEIRQFSSFRAYPSDSDSTTSDTRLIGRSVWNTRWMLIIPGVHLLGDADEGLTRLINGLPVPGTQTGERDGNGISDIELFFETFGYSGN